MKILSSIIRVIIFRVNKIYSDKFNEYLCFKIQFSKCDILLVKKNFLLIKYSY